MAKEQPNWAFVDAFIFFPFQSILFRFGLMTVRCDWSGTISSPYLRPFN